MKKYEKLLSSLNILDHTVLKDSVILYLIKEGFYLLSDEPSFRMMFKNKDAMNLIIYYSQNGIRDITINESKIKEDGVL